MTLHNRNCFASHLGHWLMEPRLLSQALAHIRSGEADIGLRKASAEDGEPEQMAAVAAYDRYVRDGASGPVLYGMTKNGTAVMDVNGPLMKGWSKYGGTSTVHLRKAMRTAMNDERVNDVILAIDSPGGHVSGTQALADDVAALNKIKPVHAQIEDLGASAAYWIASQASSISAKGTTEVGSLGVVSVVYDSSGAAEKEGVKVHVISTGAYKGAFAPGAEVKPEHLDQLQLEVNAINEHFQAAVMAGRRMSKEQMAAVSDGRVWQASAAKALGLVDHLRSLDETIASIETRRAAVLAKEQRSKRVEAAETAQVYYSLAQIAMKLGEEEHRVRYIIASRSIHPCIKVGRMQGFDKAALERIRLELAAAKLGP